MLVEGDKEEDPLKENEEAFDEDWIDTERLVFLRNKEKKKAQ